MLFSPQLLFLFPPPPHLPIFPTVPPPPHPLLLSALHFKDLDIALFPSELVVIEHSVLDWGLAIHIIHILISKPQIGVIVAGNGEVKEEGRNMEAGEGEYGRENKRSEGENL